MSSTNNCNYEEFRTDLIKRFFNTQSYFFLSLSAHLQKISDTANKITEQDYLVVSQVLERLIDSENPSSQLSSLNEIDCFRNFSACLDENCRKLFLPDHTPEEIEATIDILANNFSCTLIEIIHHEQDSSRLFKIFAIPSPKREFENTDSFDFQTETPTSTRDERITNFRYDADLYFRVADEAIEQLASNQNSRIALENLELASYSLKGLARKLGLELLAKLPELTEEIVKKIISLHIVPAKETYGNIKKVFSLLKITTVVNKSIEKKFLALSRELMRISRSLDELKSTQDEEIHERENGSRNRSNLLSWRTGRARPLAISSFVAQKQNGMDTETNDLTAADCLNA
jgi:hypothetical protein